VWTDKILRSSIDQNRGGTHISILSAVFQASLCPGKTSKLKPIFKETSVKIFLAITSSVGIVTLLFGGYVFLKAIPDVGRYIRISRM